MNVAMRADVRKLTVYVVQMSGDTSVPATKDIISSPLTASVSFHLHFSQSYSHTESEISTNRV